MLYFPPFRRLLLPSLVCLAIILYYRSSARIPTKYNFSRYILEQPDLTPRGTRIPLGNLESRSLLAQTPLENYLSPSMGHYYNYPEPGPESTIGQVIVGKTWVDPAKHPYLAPLFECPTIPNRHTNHIRLPNMYFNISVVVTGETENEKRSFLNPAIISLPHWSKNQYLLVSRVQTDGSHMINLLCEANICHTPGGAEARPGEWECDAIDLNLMGIQGGMRCATPPVTLNVPPTPAEHCGDGTGILMDIPGFHDPRVFWSGRGEPLMMMNSQSRYACFGLWIIDLRKLHLPLQNLLASNPSGASLGPLMSYPSLTELTRNPPRSRDVIEKNWMFFSSRQGSYIHYDMSIKKRTFAKLLGGGLTTVNLTDPFEQPCLVEASDGKSDKGSWHQGTNSLRLILCDRHDENCRPNVDNEIFFSLVHRKHKGMLGLPLRYERYFIVWSAAPPFSMLAVSRHPILMANETASGWDPGENWEDDEEHQNLVANGKKGKENGARFTYTVSLAWASGRAFDQPSDKNVGYLDDEVILGIGVDDAAQVYARVLAKDLLQCLRSCPGRGSSPLGASYDPEEEALDTHGIPTTTQSVVSETPTNLSEVQSSLAAEISSAVEESSSTGETSSRTPGSASGSSTTNAIVIQETSRPERSSHTTGASPSPSRASEMDNAEEGSRSVQTSRAAQVTGASRSNSGAEEIKSSSPSSSQEQNARSTAGSLMTSQSSSRSSVLEVVESGTTASATTASFPPSSTSEAGKT